MGYQILRVSKIKSVGALKALLDHAYRERPTPNADASRTHLNALLVDAGNVAQGIERFNALMPAKHRKDAVLCLEYLVTGSRDDLTLWDKPKQDQYFAEALDWIKERHGAKNVFTAVVHQDEATPHLSVFVVPLVEEKLNAKAFTGGFKALKTMQDDFHSRVAKQFNLERGTPGARAHHIPIAKMYAMSDLAIQEPQKSPIELNKLMGFKDGVWTSPVPSPSLGDYLSPQNFAKKASQNTRAEVLTQMNQELDLAKTRIDELTPKAQRYALSKVDKIRQQKRESELDLREMGLANQEKHQQAIIDDAKNKAHQEGYANGIAVGQYDLSSYKEMAGTELKNLQKVAAEIQKENAVLAQAVAQEKALHAKTSDALTQERLSHQKTKEALSTLIKEVAHAIPQRLTEIKQWARSRLGLDRPVPKQERGPSR